MLEALLVLRFIRRLSWWVGSSQYVLGVRAVLRPYHVVTWVVKMGHWGTVEVGGAKEKIG